jgi:hypothetical protein
LGYTSGMRIPAALLLIFSLMISSVQASELLDKALADYDYRLDRYRSSYGEFLLSREDFQKNDSFANQEKLVTASRQVMNDRALVWHAYWQALRTEIVEAQGFDSDQKRSTTEAIEGVQTDLLAHVDTLNTLDTRGGLLAEAQSLNVQAKPYNQLAYQSLLKLRLARFNWALAQLDAFVPVLEENITLQIRDTTEKSIRLRGIHEIKELLANSRHSYDTAVTKYLNNSRTREHQSAYGDLVKDLSPAYASLIRVNNLLAELSKGIEL